MHTIDRLNHVIEYIEQHLDQEIDFMELYAISESSKSVLEKTFYHICSMTLSEYIRKRRLSEAVFDVRRGARVLDIALKYQYESEDSFTRAFKNLHKVTPSEARKDNCSLTLFSRIVFTFSIQGTQAMTYQIEHRSTMRIVGFKTFVEEEKAGTDYIPMLWDAITEEQQNLLLSKCNHTIDGIIGVNGAMHDHGFDYWIGVTSDEEAIEDHGDYRIPECEWIKIAAKGPLRPIPLALKKAYERFYKEWLPASHYKHAGIAEIEYYPMMGSDPLSDDYTCELWVSIERIS